MRWETLAEIRASFDDCLCPGCLSALAGKPDPGSSVTSRGVPLVWSLIAAGVLLTALLGALAFGPAAIRPLAIVGSVLSHVPLLHVSTPLSGVDEAILWQVRAPRVVLAVLVGAMLAVAGSAYQGVFQNPLADPYLLGVAAGAGLGATLAIGYWGAGSAGGVLLPVAAFVGAALAVIAAYTLGQTANGGRGTLILGGVIVALFMTALQTFLQQERSTTLRDVYAWILGGFGGADWRAVAVVTPYIAVSSLVIFLHRRVLDVLSLGDEEALGLGLNARRARPLIVLVATAGTAAAVAVSGLIGFVGIIVPHTVRLLVSPSYRAIIPLSLLIGAAFLVLADVLARSLLSPAELPIGVVTAFFGAPFFAVLLRTSKARLV